MHVCVLCSVSEFVAQVGLNSQASCLSPLVLWASEAVLCIKTFTIKPEPELNPCYPHGGRREPACASCLLICGICMQVCTHTHCASYFYVNLAQARVFGEEGVSTKKMIRQACKAFLTE